MNEKPNKVRLDVLLVEQGLAPSRERARAMIMAGLALIDEQKIEKPGTLVKTDAAIRILGGDLPFVSRGGLKLQRAIDAFGIDLAGTVMADVGASTGGFTDCALQHGAAKVFAIDVGYGQLAWKLRQDGRVINLERTNIKDVTRETIGGTVSFASIDVAFISLAKVFPAVYELLEAGGSVVALIKPQFEAGRGRVGKNGVVREKTTHIDIISEVITAAQAIGFTICGLDFSPIKGPEGNIEYLIYLQKAAGVIGGSAPTLAPLLRGEANEVSPGGPDEFAALIKNTVEQAHDALDKKTPAETEKNYLISLKSVSAQDSQGVTER